MDKRRNPHSGHQAKSKLINVLKSSAVNDLSLTCLPVDCLVIDGFCMLRHVTKTADVKTGADLVKMVSKWIDKRGANCVTVAVAFDTYKDESLKATKREGIWYQLT